jgi:transposase
MGAPISEDLRMRVVSAYKAGRGTYREIAELFGIGEASVDRWLRLDREQDSVEAAPHGGGTPAKVPQEKYPNLVRLVTEKPDRSVLEIRDEWERREGVSLSRSAMQRALLKAGFRWKKNAFVQVNSSARRSKNSAPRSVENSAKSRSIG